MKKEIKDTRPAEKQLAEFIKKNVVPGAGDVLDKLKTQKDITEILLDELESFIDGRAYDKEIGLPWKHRLEHVVELIAKYRAVGSN